VLVWAISDPSFRIRAIVTCPQQLPAFAAINPWSGPLAASVVRRPRPNDEGPEFEIRFGPCPDGQIDRIDAERERLLHIYLADHLAGSAGGVSLAKRIARQNPGNEFGREMSQIAGAIEEDQAALERIMERVGARTRRWRQAGAVLGERVSRLKTNGKLFSHSPLSRVLELEGMIIGVSGKLQLWRSLLETRSDDSRFDLTALERLRGRAEEQRRQLELLHAHAAKQGF
jgi:hypothetical protein